jgi:hypothetical protein
MLGERCRWTRGALARTLVDDPVLPLSDSAWRWSLAGAVALALFEVLGPHSAACDWDRAYTSTVAALWHVLPADYQRAHETLSLDLDRFNDDPDIVHRDVVELVDCALAVVYGKQFDLPIAPSGTRRIGSKSDTGQ